MLQSWLKSLAFLFGLVLVYVGERIMTPGTSRKVMTLVGLAVALAPVVVRALRWRKAEGERRTVERMLLLLKAAAVGALLMYFLQSDVFAAIFGAALEKSSPKLAVVLGALWPAILVAALLPLVLVEMSYASMARAPQLELGRVRDAALSGLGLAGALVFVFALMYVVSQRDAKWDLSYARTTKAGDATRKIAASLEEPVQVALFFPPANEVAEQVESYFDDLKRESSRLEVQQYDHALDPQKAKELSVSGNGVIVIARGTRREQLFVGTELEKARSQLRNLDQEVQKRLLQVAKSKKTIYLTSGHGERLETPASATDQRATVRALREELRAQNYELKNLSIAEGLGAEVPKDAAAVLVLGPTTAFLPPEVAALKAYFERGGRLLIALDPEPGLDHAELLEMLGLSFKPEILANDVAYARVTAQLSDRAFIGTNSYSSHPSVTTNGRMNSPMYLMGAGHLDERPQRPADLAIDFAVRAHHQSWNDANGNYQHDPPQETRKGWALAAAVTRRPPGSTRQEEQGRAVVLADSDALSDQVLALTARMRGNADFVLDGLKWLLGDEAIAGSTNTEQDVPITRTRTQDVVWFFASVFVAPAVIVGAGVLAVRKRKRRSRVGKGGAS